jgi:hypothetical protein
MQMEKFRLWTIVWFPALITLMISASAFATEKPNILVIWGDDVGMYNISAYHRGMMGGTTPNIDRIAKEGAMFTDAYASKAVPPVVPRLFSASTLFAPVF